MIIIDPLPAADGSRIDWFLKSRSLFAAGVCVLVYAIAAWLLSPAAFAAFLKHYAREISFYLPLLIFPVCLIGMFVRRQTTFSTNSSHLIGRLQAVILLTIGLLLVFSAFTTFKFKIPDIVPFYADRWAADLDAFLHGRDTWQLAHAVWPEAWSGFIELSYSWVWLCYWFGTPVFVLLWMPRNRVKLYLWSLLLTFIICGTLLATLYSSVGPIFYAEFLHDARYAGLTDSLEALQMESVRNYAGYLLASYRDQKTVMGTGISAIPSMHVAVVTLNAWLFSSINRWAGSIAWAFCILILFSSVYTGWHYAVDGYMSLLAVTTIWFAVRRVHLAQTVKPKTRSTGLQVSKV